MALYEISPARGSGAQGSGAKLARPVELICFALIVVNAVYLAASYVEGSWLIAPNGSGIESDFVNVWAAGRLALAGHAAAAYDWPTHKLMEETAVGHAFDGYFGWHYPPTFLFVAAVLSLLPYAAAYALWAFATFPGLSRRDPRHHRRPRGLSARRRLPGGAAQFHRRAERISDREPHRRRAGSAGRKPDRLPAFCSGFSPTSRISGSCFRSRSRPAAIGAPSSPRRSSPILMAAASWLAFGSEAWLAFLGNIGHTSQAFLSEGWADWSKLQTAFGLTRTLGGSETLAWIVQAAVSLLAAVSVAIVWRSKAAYDLKAAALGVGVLLATPYLYTYDLVVLAVPIAFLLRLANARGYLPKDLPKDLPKHLPKELIGIGIACGLILIFPFVKFPVGLAALLLIAGLVARRIVLPASAAA